MLKDQQAKLLAEIEKIVPLRQRKHWVAELAKPRAALPGQTCMEWLKQSPRSRRGQGLAGAFERIHFLSDLKVDSITLPPMPLGLTKAYANRAARLKLTRFNRLQPASQTIGLSCFLQLALWRTTDEAIEAWLMRVAEVRRAALERAVQVSEHEWQQRHAGLLSRVNDIAGRSGKLREPLAAVVRDEESIAQHSRAQRARSKLPEMSAQVRSLLRLILRLPLALRAPTSWLAQALPLLRAAYLLPRPSLAAGTALEFLPARWSGVAAQADEGQRLRVLEAATLLQLQRSLRNAAVFVPTSLSYREHESLLIPRPAWEARRGAHLQLLDSSPPAEGALKALLPKVSQAMITLARAVRQGSVIVTEQRGIELPGIEGQSIQQGSEAEERMHRAWAARLGALELPRLMMELDAQVRFSSTLLRRVPDNAEEIMALYGALLAHGMEAAHEIQTKGMRLAQRLYVPEPFREEAKAEIAQRRREAFAMLQAPEEDGRLKLALVLGKLKGSEAASFGRKVWVKHMPDCPLFIEAKAWARIERRFAALFEAREAHPDARLRLALCALIYAKREHIYQIDSASLMLASENWIPIDGAHEVELIQRLTQASRCFLKPLRYDAPAAAAFPNVLLLDTGVVPTPLHVLSPFMSAKERAAKEQAIQAAGETQWVWHTEQPIPSLPPLA